ncbi:hypothetical protein M2281_001180 [Mesorhizobium soli]|uniref:DUF2066 domain-containing protein n=1 Tax=Pseudaminobacter soli (ex Li et al. 2025) TaxID=1295366 RepID=UPI002475C034|nr:DUF2066 domain-containing protein [Mesorhizobium soli]MDH6230608.1 hypothetical protein [Mesorhizobium soli]
MRLDSKSACLLAVLLVAAMLSGRPAVADDADALYRATVVVSGQGEERRALGFALCLKDVLARVSGDQRLADSERVNRLAAEAGSYVTGFGYRDRLAGRPLHDEQGSYDRPHDLTCDFDRTKIDALLGALGSKPWPAPRPRVVLLVRVSDMKGRGFTLANDSSGPQDQDMRGSLEAASKRFALPFLLPEQAALAAEGQDVGTLPKTELADLAGIAGDDTVVAGTLAWSDKALGWVADWRLPVGGKTYEWHARGVGYDDAFRNVVAGAAQILSGNGQPADLVK